ncbi:MAG: DUF1295 domain-containing protein [Candidatus Dadabacteria bacterium]|nr:MAG: DUF1295 domain-containing protein [Candidatus Dadabacteria bacterium]
MWWRAPYGRYARQDGPWSLPVRLGWILMEAPASLVTLYCFVRGRHAGDFVPLLFLGMWQLHYVDRAFFYPLRMRSAPGARMPLSIAAMSFAYQVVNGYLNGSWIGHYGSYSTSWLLDWRFLAGTLVFAIGFGVNRWADHVLRNLRKPGESGYKIPRGGLYELVSCPNFFGEILTWSGWALATWSLAGLSFAMVTAANLIPRGIEHHRWYREKFPEYPASRRAVIPFVI